MKQSMLDELEEMICFAAICEAGSMTAASQTLGCSKAHVSRMLTALEQRVGIKLLHRTTRALTLTDSGRRLSREALQLYRRGQQLKHRALSLREQLTGSFVITAPVSLASILLIPELPDLQKAFPDIDFEIRPTNENLDLIHEGVDLAVRTGSVVDDRLVAVQVGLAQDIFYAPRALTESVHAPREITEVLRHRLLLNPYSMEADTIRLSAGEESVALNAVRCTRVSEYPLLLDLAQRVDGIALAPNYCTDYVAQRYDMAPLLEHWRGRQWPILLVYPFQSPLPLKLTKVMAVLRQLLAPKLA